MLHQERTLTERLEGISTGIRGLMYPLPKTVEINKNQAGLPIAGESTIVTYSDGKRLAWGSCRWANEAGQPTHWVRGADVTFSIWS